MAAATVVVTQDIMAEVATDTPDMVVMVIMAATAEAVTDTVDIWDGAEQDLVSDSVWASILRLTGGAPATLSTNRSG